MANKMDKSLHTARQKMENMGCFLLETAPLVSVGLVWYCSLAPFFFQYCNTDTAFGQEWCFFQLVSSVRLCSPWKWWVVFWGPVPICVGGSITNSITFDRKKGHTMQHYFGKMMGTMTELYESLESFGTPLVPLWQIWHSIMEQKTGN